MRPYRCLRPLLVEYVLADYAFGNVKNHSARGLQTLSFHPGHFSGLQLDWYTLEKEACVILVTAGRLHWLLGISNGFDLYTDLSNLIFLFDL